MAKQQQKKSINKKVVVLQKLDFRWPALIAIIAFTLYANTITHDYALDDWGAITNNQFVQQGIAGIPKILKVDLWHFGNLTLGYYRPLSLITFAIEHELFGNNPHISHFINILLFALTGFVLCLLLTELFRAYHIAFAFLISLLFVAHPIHTEVVANLKSRDELMGFLGVITVMFLMFRHANSGKIKYLIMSLVIYYLAMLSKESSIVGLALLPATWFFFKEKSVGECIKKTIPFIIVVAVFFFQKYKMMGTLTGQVPNDIVNYPYVHAKLPSTFLIFTYCLKLLFLPHPLIYDYSYNQIPPGTWSNIFTLLGLLIFLVLAFYTYRGIVQKTIWGFALAVFFITFIPPVAFVLTRGGIMAERFLYSASLGFCIALVYFISKALKIDFTNKELKMPAWIRNNVKLAAVIAVIFGAYSFKTVDRNKAWKDNFTLFASDISNASNSCQNNKHLGSEIVNKAIAETDPKKKMEYFHQALPLLTKAVTIHPKFGEAWCTLGVAYQVVNVKPDSAIYFYHRAIESSPGYAISYGNMGILYQGFKKYELASYYYNKAIEINPTFLDAQRNAEALRKATGLDVHAYPGGEDPRLKGASQQTGAVAFVEQGRDAIYYFKTGTDYATKGNFNNAIANLQKAIEVNPQYTDAYINLANCYGMLKNYSAAIETYTKLLSSIGPNARAYENMAVTYDLMGNEEQADIFRQKAKELKK